MRLCVGRVLLVLAALTTSTPAFAGDPPKPASSDDAATAQAAGTATPPTSDHPRPAPPLRVFVGRLVGAEPLPEYTFDDGTVLFDTGWTLRYEVLHPLRGEFDAQPVELDYWGHNGLVEFGRYDTALVFVFGPDPKTGEHVMARYRGFPAVRTLDGRWAVCGGPHPVDGHVPPRLQRLKLDRQLRYNTLVPADQVFIPDRSRLYAGKKGCLGVPVERLLEHYAADAEPGYMRTW